MFQAWGDESGSVTARDPGAFILAAAISLPGDAPQLRSAMAGLQMKTEKKIHWRDDSDKRRRQVIETIAELPLEAIVVARVGPTSEPDERRRRKCFEHFAMEVDALGCTQLTMESRGRKADRRDRIMLDTMRAQKTVTGDLRLDHAPGPTDPCLWIADAICGAVVAARVGNRTFLDIVGSKVQIIEA